MPTADELSASIARAVAEVGEDLDVDDVASDKQFVEDLRIDSLAMIEIIVILEEEHGVRVPDEAVRGFRRVGDLETWLAGATS